MRTKKIATYGLLIALAIILSYLETLVPLSVAIPGIKMGLPNIVIVFVLYKFGFKDACVISFLRIFLVSAMFGNMFSCIYSCGGALLSLPTMFLLRKTEKFGKIGVGVAGGVAHNAGQIIVAVIVTQTVQIGYYFPILCISGTVAGICIGIVAGILVDKIKLQ